MFVRLPTPSSSARTKMARSDSNLANKAEKITAQNPNVQSEHVSLNSCEMLHCEVVLKDIRNNERSVVGIREQGNVTVIIFGWTLELRTASSLVGYWGEDALSTLRREKQRPEISQNPLCTAWLF